MSDHNEEHDRRLLETLRSHARGPRGELEGEVVTMVERLQASLADAEARSERAERGNRGLTARILYLEREQAESMTAWEDGRETGYDRASRDAARFIEEDGECEEYTRESDTESPFPDLDKLATALRSGAHRPTGTASAPDTDADTPVGCRLDDRSSIGAHRSTV